jgi:mono/diheme cytochrome c family protein
VVALVWASMPGVRCTLLVLGWLFAAPMMAQSSVLATAVPELVEKHCGGCHTGNEVHGDDVDGDFDIASLFGANVTKDEHYVLQLSHTVQRLRARTMPPPDEQQPSDVERRELAALLSQLAPSKPGDRMATVRRLTRRQYEHTVRDLFGITWRANDLLPEDSPAHGFDGQGDVQNMSPLLFEKYHDAAAEVATAVLADNRSVFAQATPLVESLPSLLARAFRRPVTSEEVAERAADAAGLREAGMSDEQVRHAALRSVLVSPSFLLRAEFGQVEAPAKLSAHELAVRLAFLLTSSTPDNELRKAADDGTLLTRAVVTSQALRLSRAHDGRRLASDFATQWLGLREVLTATADFRRYKQIWNRQLRPSFLQEALHYFAAIVREDRSVLELLDSDYTFVNPVLAKHYGLPKVEKGFHRVKLSDARRGGVLGMGVMLMTSSFPLRTSPVKRGKWILDKLLDSPPPPPPADAGTLPKDDKPSNNLTLRQRLEKHRESRRCAGCHATMDALGFALENYDVVGRWRDELHGSKVDTVATLPDGTMLRGPVELKKALVARGDDFVRALAKNLLVHGVGREMGMADEPELAKIVAATRAGGDRFSVLLTAIVTSPLFRMRDPGAVSMARVPVDEGQRETIR